MITDRGQSGTRSHHACECLTRRRCPCLRVRQQAVAYIWPARPRVEHDTCGVPPIEPGDPSHQTIGCDDNDGARRADVEKTPERAVTRSGRRAQDTQRRQPRRTGKRTSPHRGVLAPQRPSHGRTSHYHSGPAGRGIEATSVSPRSAPWNDRGATRIWKGIDSVTATNETLLQPCRRSPPVEVALPELSRRMSGKWRRGIGREGRKWQRGALAVDVPLSARPAESACRSSGTSF